MEISEERNVIVVSDDASADTNGDSNNNASAADYISVFSNDTDNAVNCLRYNESLMDDSDTFCNASPIRPLIPHVLHLLLNVSSATAVWLDNVNKFLTSKTLLNRK